MTPADRPRLPRGVRLHHDRVRDTPVLLGPEVALMLDPVGQAVLAELDGARDLATIAQELAARYDAPVETVLADIAEFLDGLAARRLVDVA
ncbi:MAG: pyrroloquinoline quinone biosynthesis peptide chaperone PqqD [Paracoccus sp. (in: a-proteobacteria)]|jgi:pyrroloquinoline quinone biosynthesis protein D|uniref:pyrroloquinoline quinone biosynthesis peptide chaperone PqqD n=1 Tax=Paracoccus sp. TaxID=267 RepID=UPI0035B1E883